MSGAGKGSRPRKVDFEKFGKNYDNIFSKNKKNNMSATSAK